MGANAQHAADNAVTAADDAFRLTLGLESIGMYSPGQIRGFSPKSAGNLRVDGLYFDQQAVDALGHKSKSVGIDQLLIAGAHLPAIINQKGEFPI